MGITYRLGIDIGGTFTDLSLFDQSSKQIFAYKVSSTPHSPSEAVARGIKELTESLGTTAEAIESFVHGTTIGLNAILERRGANVALFVTEGTHDILEIARLKKTDQFNLRGTMAAPLVPRRWVVPVRGRIGADGTVLEEISEDEVAKALLRLREQGVESFAICLLNAHANDRHEKVVAKVIASGSDTDYCSRSTALWPEIREYERASVAVLNAYVKPIMVRYVAALERDTAAIGLAAKLYITRSNGGVMSAVTAGEKPVDTLLSGPASGVVGAAYISRQCGVMNAVTCDIGGTSADVSVIRDGEPVHSTEAVIGDFPLVMPTVDVFSVGAGGGSIARFDVLGLLKLGPSSAGAVPGPAAYGRGGEEPTVTDAYLVCGYIDPDNFVGGSMKLQRGLAEKAIGKIADRLGVSLEQAAESILQLATSNMATALLPMMTKRGIDPRDFTLIPYGGAGATHACRIAEDLNISQLLVPPSPGTLCALGAMIADLKGDYIHSCRRNLSTVSANELLQAYSELEREARDWLRGENPAIEDIVIERSADMRFEGQAFDIEVALPLTTDLDGIEVNLLADLFRSRYKDVYSDVSTSSPMLLTNFRLRIVGRNKPLALLEIAKAEKNSAPPVKATRDIFYDGKWQRANVYDRSSLLDGHVIEGPAIVEQFDTTTVVAANFVGTVNRFNALFLAKKAQQGDIDLCVPIPSF